MNPQLSWSADQLSTTIDSLSIGSSQYAWHSIGSPEIIYRRDGAVTFNEFIVESNEDYFEVDGTFSESLKILWFTISVTLTSSVYLIWLAAASDLKGSLMENLRPGR